VSKEVDIGLIARCIAGDQQAQKKLYDLTLPYLNVMCKRYLTNEANIKDVLQETFIRIFKNIDQFDVQRASFKTWVTKIAINNCLKNNTKESRISTEELSTALDQPKVDPIILSSLNNADIIKWLKQMPESYYAVFNLYVIDDFSHQEIAQLLNIEIPLSRKRLSRARDWIKKRQRTGADNVLKFSFN